jgi:hypothetical protein
MAPTLLRAISVTLVVLAIVYALRIAAERDPQVQAAWIVGLI